MSQDFTPTPHNDAKKGEIAKTVLMPGDPLRAKYIAENFLDDIKLVNTVRNMLCYTGTYEGKPVSVMGSGMGPASIGIYSYELFHFYDVDTIIRVGSTGAMQPEVKLRDIVIGQSAATNSNYGHIFRLAGTPTYCGDFGLIEKAVAFGRANNMPFHVGPILSSDNFYGMAEDEIQAWVDFGILATEMESSALYGNAMAAHKKALTILTVSDLLYDFSQVTTAEERQIGFNNMIRMGLSLI